jgi:hypothetical protein
MVIREGPMEDLSAFSAKPRLRLLLDQFSQIKDTRQSWKVAYPLRKVLFLVVCVRHDRELRAPALADRLELFDLRGQRGVEITLGVLMQGWLVVLSGAASRADRPLACSLPSGRDPGSRPSVSLI